MDFTALGNFFGYVAIGAMIGVVLAVLYTGVVLATYNAFQNEGKLLQVRKWYGNLFVCILTALTIGIPLGLLIYVSYKVAF